MKESVEISILGRTYAFRSEFDQKFMSKTADLVNTKMKEIMDRTGTVTTEKVAILAAMNLAGELLQSKNESGKIKNSVKESSDRILKLVNSLL